MAQSNLEDRWYRSWKILGKKLGILLSDLSKKEMDLQEPKNAMR